MNIKPGTLGNWLRYDNLITITAKETPRGASLPFIALVEALLVCELRKIGLSIKAIVAAMGEARKQLGSDMFKQDRLIEYGKGMNNDGFM
ncbi:MAG: hypothetical protein FWH50_01935, partial [Coriobacteriia bacterium]|nr:hypothetical protein [Coriobacteriia bacterium]